MGWILLSLNAAFFFALRYVVIKKYLPGVSSVVLAFTGRLTGLVMLLPLLLWQDAPVGNVFLFWSVVAATSILTAAASLMQLHAVKKHDLSSSIPFLSFVPLFMIAGVYVLFGETPTLRSLAGIVMLALGAYVLNMERGMALTAPFSALAANRGGMLFLGVALIFGVTTSLDRVAIDTAGGGGFAYSLYWHLFSVVLFAMIFMNRAKAPGYVREIRRSVVPLVVQGAFSIIAFYSQMTAVELAKNVEANVIYVKGLTMMQLFIGVMFGVTLFGERNAPSRIAGSLLMIGGALFMMLFR